MSHTILMCDRSKESADRNPSMCSAVEQWRNKACPNMGFSKEANRMVVNKGQTDSNHSCATVRNDNIII